MSDNQKPETQNTADKAGQNASSQNQEQYQYGAQQGAAAPHPYHPYPPQQPPYGYTEPPQQNMGGNQYGHGGHGGHGGHNGHNHHHAPVYPYQAQNQPMPPPVAPPPPQYHNPYYDPYMGQYPAAHYNNQPVAPAPENGLASFFNFRDERFLKGALVGAAVTFLLTNDSVQKNAISSIAKVWHLFQGGFEEVKERFRDAEAEIKAQDK